MSTHWSLGFLVGTPICLVVIAALLLSGRYCIRRSRSIRDDFDRKSLSALGIGLLCVGVIVSVVTALTLFPYRAEYHQWRPVSGRVTQSASRLIPAGSRSVQQRFVVEVNGRLYGCDDTRCATVQVGDTINLYCIREWQYASVSGYGCRWAS